MYLPPKEKPLCPPERPPRFEDVPYAEVPFDDGSLYTLRLDIYQSETQTAPGPCVVYYFGGAWMWGDYKQTVQKAVYCRDLVRLCEKGLTVVCPSYRLAQQAVFRPASTTPRASSVSSRPTPRAFTSTPTASVCWATPPGATSRRWSR